MPSLATLRSMASTSRSQVAPAAGDSSRRSRCSPLVVLGAVLLRPFVADVAGRARVGQLGDDLRGGHRAGGAVPRARGRRQRRRSPRSFRRTRCAGCCRAGPHWRCPSRRRPASPCPAANAARSRSPGGSSRTGSPPAAALAFLLAAPAINPVVLRGDRGGVSRATGDGARPVPRQPAGGDRGRVGLGGPRAARARRRGLAGERPRPADRRRRRSWPPRSTTSSTPAASSSSARPPRRRCRPLVPEVDPRRAVAAPGCSSVLALAGAGGRAGDLLGGRRLRRRRADAVLARPPGWRSSSSARWST